MRIDIESVAVSVAGSKEFATFLDIANGGASKEVISKRRQLKFKLYESITI